MNQSTKNRLRTIFAKEIDKDCSELGPNDYELFEDWIASGLAAEHISSIDNDTVRSHIEDTINRDKPAKCRNCDNLIINLVNKKAFGNTTLQLAVYCGYWLHKNNNGLKNSLYNVSVDDPSCTQFLSHRNVLDHYNIDVSDMNYMPITSEDFSTLPLTSFIDKDFNIRKIDGQFFLVRENKDEDED